MKRPGLTLVAILFTALVYSTHVYSLDPSDFSHKLRDVAEDILGVKEFQEYLRQRMRFAIAASNGMDHVQLIASEISRHVRDRVRGVRRLKDAVIESFRTSTSTVMPECCPTENLGLISDPRFPVKANTNTGCLFGKEAPKKNGKPYVKGISSGLVQAMQTNLRTIPGVKWQYYGNTQGIMYSYPAKSSCHRSTYDPRLRPWYSFTATSEKDIIIMIDKSKSMRSTYLSTGQTKLFVAIQAAKTLILSLNSNDKAGVLLFDNEVQLPSNSDDCYRSQLALATKANKQVLTKFVTEIPPNFNQPANYSRAFQRAFRLFSTTSNSSESATRSKVIVLLANGDPHDSLTSITQSIVAGQQLIGSRVTILSYGLNTNPTEDKNLRNISEQTGGQFKRLDNPDTEKIKQSIGAYYDFFVKRSDDNNVVFTVPYNDSGGLGMVTSACLSIVAEGSFRGVTCMDIPIDTLFSPIIDFHLGRLSYAFLIDSRGRVLLHPLLPKPHNYKQHPIFLDMESVEISSATVAIKASMISGTTGNMTVTDLRLFSSRGYSLHDGVTLSEGATTYYWSPISVMNASVGLVIIEGEKNVSVSWTDVYPDILFADELQLNDVNKKCNNFGRIASTDSSAVKLSPKSFVEPYNYTQQLITDDMLQQFKNYLKHQTTQTSFVVTPGVRESVALTHKLEQIWKRSAANRSNLNHIGQLGNFALYRYVGTREGVYRVYPALRVPIMYDPTKQPWYRRSEAQRSRLTLSTQTDRNGDVITSLAKAFVDDRGNDVLGVIGADIPFSSVYNFMITQFDGCKNPNYECFAIDRSGFILAHRDFLANPPSTQVHITTKEPKIAADMVKRNIMTLDSCVNYADITNQRFYVIELHGSDRALTSGHVYAVPEVDMNIVIKDKEPRSQTLTCTCPRSVSDRVRCEAGDQCQCPCYTSTDYSYCTGHFTTNNTKTCYPSTLPIYLVDLSVEEQSVVSSLSSCLQCSVIADQRLCTTTGCCWESGNCSTCPSTAAGCDRLCLGLAIGLPVGVVLLVIIIIVVVVVCRRRRTWRQSNDVMMYSAGAPAPHKTVIQVTADAGTMSGYDEIPANTSSSSAKDYQLEDEYLHQ